MTPQKKSSSGYQLGEWDEFIIHNISLHQRALISSDLFDLAKNKLISDGQENVSDFDLRGKLNRSIRKLANDHRRIIKASYPGKGYAYALIEWADESGAIGSEYL
ncbi:MAG: hypothetical protein KDC34_16675 [Saprospiraceae bacterium]|nr:hypothetical protein [Saprospiraceae bacterium]